MKRDQVQHVIRAAAKICDETDFVIVGSQAVHGSVEDVDDEALIRSIEVDLYPLHAPNKSELLNVIGVLSKFHDAYGYYADGVDETTAVLPKNWEFRLKVISGPLLRTSMDFGQGDCVRSFTISSSQSSSQVVTRISTFSVRSFVLG